MPRTHGKTFPYQPVIQPVTLPDIRTKYSIVLSLFPKFVNVKLFSKITFYSNIWKCP